MNNNYYKKLSLKYFEATLSPREERRLKAFLATTRDPDFDDAKAVVGYFAAGRAAAGRIVRPASWRWIPVTAISAAAAIAVIVGVHIGKEKQIPGNEALASMENTLASIFSSGTDVETELSGIMNQ